MSTQTVSRYLFHSSKIIPVFGKRESSLVLFLAPSFLSALPNKGLFVLTQSPLLTWATSTSIKKITVVS